MYCIYFAGACSTVRRLGSDDTQLDLALGPHLIENCHNRNLHHLPANYWIFVRGVAFAR